MRPRYASGAVRAIFAGTALVLLPLTAITLSTSPLGAHEGHDHGAPPAAFVTTVAPRVEASSELFELVGVVRREAMVLFLDRFATNEPVTRASIEVTADGGATQAEPQPDGSFLIKAPWLAKTGPVDLVFTVHAAEVSDLLIGTLQRPEPGSTGDATAESLPAALAHTPVLWALGLALLMGGIVLGRGLPIQRKGVARPALVAEQEGGLAQQAALENDVRAKRRAGASAGLAFIMLVTSPGTALSHGGENHGPPEASPAAQSAPTVVTESPRRLADGSLFVPKPTQRLLTVRTQPARIQQAARTVTITGRVIADPTAGGRVQAAQGGRIEPPADGLPVLGQRVVRDQVLATVMPVITTVERSGLREQLAQIDSGIAIAEQRVARLSQLEGSVPKRDIDEARRELEGLRQRRKALAPALAEREVVRASASGVISVANVVAGQLIDAGEVLFEIVDPAKLWVEAIAYDPAAVVDIRSAVASTADGETLPLDLIGRSLTLRQQAVPVLFRITRPSSTLKVGTPVSVILQRATSEAGIVLPSGSIVSAASGEDVVFEHVSGERFIPRPVRYRPLDGERVVVHDGVEAGARIVTESADLLGQIR